MALFERRTLPNAITIGRIILAPVVFILIFVPGFLSRVLAFILFLAAAFSDLWDGHLARKHGWISDFGKLVDPIADKLLLVATFIPFYILSHRGGVVGPLPIWGASALPLWVLLVIFGREVAITVLRSVAARRGMVIPAGGAGKVKAVFQNIFIGSALAWYAIVAAGQPAGWSGDAWRYWTLFHTFVTTSTLLVALALTVYSFGVFLWQWRSGGRG
jgi:CDP-diacylglycerol---glycerol-3-phosphate 3-phosphatidyltransferase